MPGRGRFLGRSRIAGRLAVAAIVLLVAATAGAHRGATQAGLRVTHGVAAGDVTSTTALIWARASSAARMEVVLTARGKRARRVRGGTAVAARDFTARTRVGRLSPATTYRYAVRFVRGRVRSRAAIGTFTTPPAATTLRPVSFVFSGDLGGQEFCRRVDAGYPIFRAMARTSPSFFVANGDMIYSDYECTAAGPDGPGGWENIELPFNIAWGPLDWRNEALMRRHYFAHWEYNRADVHQRALLARTVLYSQWDDHEVINDFGASWPLYPPDPRRQGYRELVRAGRTAFFSYAAIAGDRIYRSFRWGRAAELFLLDCRSYRSRNDVADTPQNAKTMLGRAQLDWLVQRVTRSTATWKILSSDVSIGIASGTREARDGWVDGDAVPRAGATGFERELLSLLARLDAANVTNVVFLATDVHHSQTIRYARDFNGDGDALVFHELISGPLSARSRDPGSADPTLAPTVLYAEGNFRAFGHVAIRPAAGGGSRLVADVRDEAGNVRPGSRIELTAP